MQFCLPSPIQWAFYPPPFVSLRANLTLPQLEFLTFKKKGRKDEKQHQSGCLGDVWFLEAVTLTVGSELAGHLLQYTREQLTQVPWKERQGSV